MIKTPILIFSRDHASLHVRMPQKALHSFSSIRNSMSAQFSIKTDSVASVAFRDNLEFMTDPNLSEEWMHCDQESCSLPPASEAIKEAILLINALCMAVECARKRKSADDDEEAREEGIATRVAKRRRTSVR